LIGIPFRNLDGYASLKRAADLEFGVQTVCALGTKIKFIDQGENSRLPPGFQRQHLSNLAMKFNFKSGGKNHALENATLNRLLGPLRNSTMVLGADVAHPPAASIVGYPSIACVVASDDNTFLNYPGSMRLQAGGQEEIEDMEDMVKERLEAWYHKNRKSLPTNLLFYRDGISESMFNKCRDHEIAAIRRAYANVANRFMSLNSGQFKLTFVVVSKRHHTRFYPKRPEDSYRTGNKYNGNLKPGLLVRQVVTSPSPDNFFLQSHSAIQGTAKSAHYHVLQNSMGLTLSRIIDITHQFCYVYPRATKGVSYVAPAYLADRLCERGRVYMRGWHPPDSFKDVPKPKNKIPLTKDAVKNWKQERAAELAKQTRNDDNPADWDWGHSGKANHGIIRRNPWHPNLDHTMFWM
ncbi:stem cell self-renewal protein Piwi, partial [Amniculicola lignicola CBS 123094]